MNDWWGIQFEIPLFHLVMLLEDHWLLAFFLLRKKVFQQGGCKEKILKFPVSYNPIQIAVFPVICSPASWFIFVYRKMYVFEKVVPQSMHLAKKSCKLCIYTNISFWSFFKLIEFFMKQNKNCIHNILT